MLRTFISLFVALVIYFILRNRFPGMFQSTTRTARLGRGILVMLAIGGVILFLKPTPKLKSVDYTEAVKRMSQEIGRPENVSDTRNEESPRIRPVYIGGNALVGIVIEGEIVSGDYQQFANTLRRYGPRAGTVYLASPGGNAAEALKIGRLIRQLRLHTSIPAGPMNGNPRCVIPALNDSRNCTCASACFLIFVAGVHRSGNIAKIHRAYIPHEKLRTLNVKEASLLSNKIQKLVSEYLEEMGTPRGFIDWMYTIPSGKVENVGDEAIKQYFSGYIPEFQEWITARCGHWHQAYNRAAYLQEKKNLGRISPGEQAQLVKLDEKIEKAVECEHETNEALRAEVFQATMAEIQTGISQRSP